MFSGDPSRHPLIRPPGTDLESKGGRGSFPNQAPITRKCNPAASPDVNNQGSVSSAAAGERGPCRARLGRGAPTRGAAAFLRSGAPAARRDAAARRPGPGAVAARAEGARARPGFPTLCGPARLRVPAQSPSPPTPVSASVSLALRPCATARVTEALTHARASPRLLLPGVRRQPLRAGAPGRRSGRSPGQSPTTSAPPPYALPPARARSQNTARPGTNRCFSAPTTPRRCPAHLPRAGPEGSACARPPSLLPVRKGREPGR